MTDPLGLIVLAPLLGGGISLLLHAPRRSRMLAPGVVMVSILWAMAAALSAADGLSETESLRTVVGGWPDSLGIQLVLEPLTLGLLLVTLLVAVLVLLYAAGEAETGPVYTGVYGIAVSGMAGVMMSADLFNLFVFFEVLSLSAAILIAIKKHPPALLAAYKYLLVTVLSVALYLVGLFVLYRECGELAFPLVRDAIASGSVPPDTARLAGGLLFGGIAARVALVPFHGWLPDAHGQAPHPVSALLSGLMLKAGFVALWHLVRLFPEGMPFAELLRTIGLASALFGVFLALCQTDVKRLLAYHSISQMGFIATAAGAGATTGAMYHAMGHAVFKSLLFLVAGHYIARTGSRKIGEMRSRFAASPRDLLPAVCFLAGALSIVGVPPFTGFVSKELIQGGLKGGAASWMLKGAAAGTAASFFKLGVLGIFPATGFRRTSSEVRETFAAKGDGASGPGWVAMAGLSLLALLLGLFPEQALGVLTGGAAELPVPEASLFSPRAMGESLAVLAAGFLLFLCTRPPSLKRLLAAVARPRPGVDFTLSVTALGAGMLVLYILVM